jgi:predicted RNA binding protein YcfA (HicA-like mRNA interferase family)
MPKLTPLKPRDLIQKLAKLGYAWPTPWGKHMHMVRWSTIIPIPFHGGKEIGVGLQSMMIKELGISREEWLEL